VLANLRPLRVGRKMGKWRKGEDWMIQHQLLQVKLGSILTLKEKAFLPAYIWMIP
jgi:hypothetical protein